MNHSIKSENINFKLGDFLLEKKVLVTGHNGFKGSWLTLWLLMNGANVYGYSLPPLKHQTLFNDFFNREKRPKEMLGTLNHKIGDINDFETLSNYVNETNPDLVFHLAAQPLVQKSFSHPIETWQTNVIGSLNLLESLKLINKKCAAVFITTDKVYENKEWEYGYRENDVIGGKDPYSSSKAAMELAVSSWRESFCGFDPHQTSKVSVATARAGNVIGGGDWSPDRIVPDVINSLKRNKPILLRNPEAKRPWQHVLEPLLGYLILGFKLYEHQSKHDNEKNPYATSFNFGPEIGSNKSVKELVNRLISFWPGEIRNFENDSSPKEAKLLNLVSDKAFQMLNWQPKWNFDKTTEKTIKWYQNTSKGDSPLNCAILDIKDYQYD